MSIPRTRLAGPAAGSAAGPAVRLPGRPGGGDLLAVAGLLVGAGLIEFFLRSLLTRPFYYDEASRAYEIARGGAFLSHLGTAAATPAASRITVTAISTPLAAGGGG